MRPASLFTIILKVFGLFILKDLLIALPGLLTGLSFIVENSINVSTWFVLAQVLTFLIYFLLIYLLVFRTEWVIEKLRLTRGFADEPMPFPLEPVTVLTIVVMIIGGIIVIDAIPELVNQVLAYARKNDSPFTQQSGTVKDVLIALLKLAMGLFLLGYTRQIVAFIESRRKKVPAPIQDQGEE